MKRKMLMVLLVVLVCTGCGMLEPTCKAEGCEETDIYDEGYCKVHYYENVGDNLLKDIFN